MLPGTLRRQTYSDTIRRSVAIMARQITPSLRMGEVVTFVLSFGLGTFVVSARLYTKWRLLKSVKSEDCRCYLNPCWQIYQVLILPRRLPSFLGTVPLMLFGESSGGASTCAPIVDHLTADFPCLHYTRWHCWSRQRRSGACCFCRPYPQLALPPVRLS